MQNSVETKVEAEKIRDREKYEFWLFEWLRSKRIGIKRLNLYSVQKCNRKSHQSRPRQVSYQQNQHTVDGTLCFQQVKQRSA